LGFVGGNVSNWRQIVYNLCRINQPVRVRAIHPPSFLAILFERRAQKIGHIGHITKSENKKMPRKQGCFYMTDMTDSVQVEGRVFLCGQTLMTFMTLMPFMTFAWRG
jgi:hypothetical protein